MGGGVTPSTERYTMLTAPPEVLREFLRTNGDPFRKRPVEIYAACWAGEEPLLVPTLEGDMRCDPGDILIKGVQDEVYPCKPDIFAESYDMDGKGLSSFDEGSGVHFTHAVSPNVVEEAQSTEVDQDKLFTTDDAEVWAEEFAKLFPSIDRGLMIGWFANCIETAKDLLLRRLREDAES